MVDATQSPLAMLVLVTPYTILYLINQLFLQGVLDNVHYVFFELIFVVAFRNLFGLPDIGERLFPSKAKAAPIPVANKVEPVKTNIAVSSSNGATAASSEMSTTTDAKKIAKKTKKVRKPVKRDAPYAKEIEAMEKKFMDYVDNNNIWEKVFEESSPTPITVYQYKERPMCYKVVAILDNKPSVAFDLLSEIERRPEWDPLCVEAKTLVDISPGTKIQYLRTKGLWPTASRDTVVLATVKEIGDNGTYCNITTSIEHPSMPERTKEKIVRMETTIAGQIIGPIQDQPTKCRLIQVLDADLKGSIPQRLIQLVSTKAVPEGIRNVNAQLPTLKSYPKSKIIEIVTEARKTLESAAGASEISDEEDVDETNNKKSHHEKKGESAGSSKIEDRDLSLHVLSDRLAAVESEIGLRQSNDPLPSSSSTQGNGHLVGPKSGALHKRSGFFRSFWDGLRSSLGFGRAGGKNSGVRTRRILVTVLMLVIFGGTVRRLRRRR
ncbi:START domain-containing protein 10 [Actinomortierella ambigua]|nr:START domain-containing protein 10 [Actinomortierella ambigua]